MKTKILVLVHLCMNVPFTQNFLSRPDAHLSEMADITANIRGEV